MKKLIIALLPALITLTCFAQNYGPVPYKDFSKTIGETYILAKLYPFSNNYFIRSDKEPNERIKDKSLGGRKFTLISVNDKEAKLKDSLGNIYTEHLVLGALQDLVFESDLINARKLFLGKTLWLNSTNIFVDQNKTRSVENQIDHLRLEPVTVENVTMGVGGRSAIMFILKPAKGEEGFLECSVSGGNCGLDQKYFFKSFFFTEDPKLKYHFTPDVWNHIKAESVIKGMDKDAVWLAWGVPEKMDNSTVSSGLDQWVYRTEYVYFQNGKVVDIKQR